jgi:hypothetical protein
MGDRFYFLREDEEDIDFRYCKSETQLASFQLNFPFSDTKSFASERYDFAVAAIKMNLSTAGKLPVYPKVHENLTA